MNPMLQEAIGSILRWLLAIAAGYLVERGVWSDAVADKYVDAATLGILSLLWSLWQKYKSRLTMPAGRTEDQAKAIVDNPRSPMASVTTPSSQVPKP